MRDFRHKIESDVPYPKKVERRGYWVDLYFNMKVGDSVECQKKSEVMGLWRAAYRFKGRLKVRNTGENIWRVWKRK